MSVLGLTISCLIYYKCTEEEIELIKQRCNEGYSWEEAMRSVRKEYDQNWFEKFHIKSLN